MRLELGQIEVTDVRFGAQTQIEDRVLTIDRAELIGILEQEPLFERIEIDIAHPGESCRILRVLDVLEPRYRLNGPNFPGALEEMGLVGDGETRSLTNVAVVETDQTAPRSRNIIDMSGPAAQYTPLAARHNVVLMPYPKQGADKNDFRLAVKKAGLQTSVYLAAAAKNTKPDNRKVFELPPVAFNHGPKELPRIAYIFPIHSQQHPTQQKETVFYGSNIQGFMPTIVHPNEILDGALMFSYSAFTWFAQNHPVILELYRRHGKDLWFAGVVVTIAPVRIGEKERNAYLAARLAKETLGADGIISTERTDQRIGLQCFNYWPWVGVEVEEDARPFDRSASVVSLLEPEPGLDVAVTGSELEHARAAGEPHAAAVGAVEDLLDAWDRTARQIGDHAPGVHRRAIAESQLDPGHVGTMTQPTQPGGRAPSTMSAERRRSLAMGRGEMISVECNGTFEVGDGVRG